MTCIICKLLPYESEEKLVFIYKSGFKIERILKICLACKNDIRRERWHEIPFHAFDRNFVITSKIAYEK